MKFSYKILITCILFLAFAACQDDKPDPDKHSIRVKEEDTTRFGIWLRNNYLLTYNIEFQYKLDDFETDPTYNLTPAKIEKSQQMAVILKHLWFDAYSEVAGSTPTFMAENAPRMITLIGSTAVDPEARTETLGSAEGGVKMILYDVNSLDAANTEKINTDYLKTMHHEFAHILHQKKAYDQETFDAISAGKYEMNGWINLTTPDAWARGCPSTYACSSPREDFVEVIALFVTRSDEWWANMLSRAGDFGKPALEKKLDIATKYLKSKWDIDIRELQAAVRRRAAELPEVLAAIDFD